MTSVPSAALHALTSTNALDRALAHELLTTTQIELLYAEPGARKRAFALRRLARRIREHQLEALCRGIPERALTVIFGRTRSRVALIAALALEDPRT